ncbi:MAG: major capsid protein [Microviridae sp.]|nr:MAG: major capsid protein [Microviridae sp.]
MSSNKLFQELDLKNDVSRNGFDLSNHLYFTAKAGELLPVLHRDLMFGDKVRLSINHFTRTAPVETAAYTRINEYFDVFFVPYRLLWRNAPQVHTNNVSNPVSASSPTANQSIGSGTPQFDFSSFYTSDSPLRFAVLASSGYDMFGYSRGCLMAKLLNHLGYTYFSVDHLKSLFNMNPPEGYERPKYYGPKYLSLYPLLAYHCIYYNHFRNSQWENNVPYNYNVDYLGSNTLFNIPFWNGTSVDRSYWKNPTVFDLHYVNYPRDLFFGAFPDAQYGDTATVDVDSELVNNGTDTQYSYPVVGSDTGNAGTFAGVHAETASQNASVLTTIPQGKGINSNLYADLSDLSPHFDIPGQFNILALRKAQFLQKYKEIRGSGSQDYPDIVYKIFGVKVPQTLGYKPVYLGGRSSVIKISEVENQNLADGNQVDLKGKGTGGSNSDTFEFEAKEAGCLMVLYHARPDLDYALNALHFDAVKTEYDDFANPVFDQLGFQEIPTYFLDTTIQSSYGSDGSGHQNVLGYTTRYFDYKTAVDMTLGDFRETQKTWIAPLNFSYLSKFMNQGRLIINSNFFKVNPSILDPIFALKADPTVGSEQQRFLASTVVTDQLRVSVDFNLHMVRPLHRTGVPYA